MHHLWKRGAAPTRRPLTFMLLGLLFAIAAAGIATADDMVKVPDVEGQDVDKAIQTLERAGLDVYVIEVAGPAVEVVASQDPPKGVTMRRGGIVTIRIGIKARVETRMPDVAGKEVEDALDQLAAAYDVMVVPVAAGPRDRPGRMCTMRLRRTRPAPARRCPPDRPRPCSRDSKERSKRV